MNHIQRALHRHRVALLTGSIGLTALVLTWALVLTEIRSERLPVNWPAFAIIALLLLWCERSPATWIRFGSAGVVTPLGMFAFGLILDWARTAGQEEVERLVVTRSRDYYLADRACPLSYEPSGHDFLSPCLAEADLMRRVLGPAEFGPWLEAFLPSLPTDGSSDWLEPGIVLDPTDPKLAHLDGLNLSRAWMLEGMAAGLPEGDSRSAALRAAAAVHRESGLRAVTGEHYEGGHWLGTFAVYLVTARGLPDS